MKYFFTLSFLVACSDTSPKTLSDNADSMSDEEEYEEEYEEEPGESETSDDLDVRKILPLGDSITEGVPFTYRYSLHSRLTQEGYSFDFVGSHTSGGWDYPDSGWDRDNEGWAGWTTESIQEALSSWTPEYEVDIALIHLGTNDAGGGDVDASAAAMISIVEQLREKNDSISICIAQILPFGSLPAEDGELGADELNLFVDSWNARLAELASDMNRSGSRIVLVDMNRDFGDADLDDGVHPTRAGAEKMAEKWLACITSF